MNNQSTHLLKYSSFLKGMARPFDLFGTLNSYRYFNNPDEALIAKDWQIVGKDLMSSIKLWETNHSIKTKIFHKKKK